MEKNFYVKQSLQAGFVQSNKSQMCHVFIVPAAKMQKVGINVFACIYVWLSVSQKSHEPMDMFY